MGLKLPNRACLVDTEGRVLWVWEHNHPGEFESLPPFVTNPETGESVFLSLPNATIMDLGEIVTSRDYAEFTRDLELIRFRRRKGKDPGWAIKLIVEGEEIDHPLERKRQLRTQKRVEAQAWVDGILRAPVTDHNAPSLIRLASQVPSPIAGEGQGEGE